MTMRSVSVAILSAIVLLSIPHRAAAQDSPLHVNIGGGPTFLLGDLADRFNTGWGPAVGVTVDANERVGFQFEYAYRWFNVEDQIDAAAGRLSANHQTHQLDFNLVANLTPPDSNVRGYVVAGPGTYYRKVEITEYVGSGVICDPFYYVCGTYPVTTVLGSRGGWDFGFNVGGGVGFRVGERSEIYVETRYHYVWGPEIAPETPIAGSAGTSGNANGTYWPLTFGFRF
jgi:opacity protein-like surface antigen